MGTQAAAFVATLLRSAADIPTPVGELMHLSKARTAPDIYSERQMRGEEWDTSKMLEIKNVTEKARVHIVAKDDPACSHLRVCDTMWTGRCKRNADGTVDKYKSRCVLRGDLHSKYYAVGDNETTSPVVRGSSMMCIDAVAVLRRQSVCQFDVPGAYLQGEQTALEQVLARPPYGFRQFDERGIELLWLMGAPLYGQCDAGAIWNRTCNAALVDDTNGDGLQRCPNEPCVYSTERPKGGRVTLPLYVDDGRVYHDQNSKDEAQAVKDKLNTRFGVECGPTDPVNGYFLGANRYSTDPGRCTIKAESYIDLQAKRYLIGAEADVGARYPSARSHTPADEELVRAYDSATASRRPASREATKEYGSLFGAVLHAVKYRSEISAAMGLCGSCLTFPTPELLECMRGILVYLTRTKSLGTTFCADAEGASRLYARADSNWGETRSTSGTVTFLAGAAIASSSKRQHCITMSSTEAELYALAELAIELLHTVKLLAFIGYDHIGPVEVSTDNKGAYDLCHRFTSAANSRHIDRKLFKMRELRGAGAVDVKHIPTDDNEADLYTKILKRQPFERHRKKVLNLPGDTGVEHARKATMNARRSTAGKRPSTPGS